MKNKNGKKIIAGMRIQRRKHKIFISAARDSVYRGIVIVSPTSLTVSFEMYATELSQV